MNEIIEVDLERLIKVEIWVDDDDDVVVVVVVVVLVVDVEDCCLLEVDESITFDVVFIKGISIGVVHLFGLSQSHGAAHKLKQLRSRWSVVYNTL